MSDSQTRQIRQTIGMLNSMIKSGESHSPTSEKMIELSKKALDGVEQRLGAGQVDAIVSGWIEIEGNEVLYGQVCTDDTMIRFDDGSECRYADDWPFAEATHFKLKGIH